MNFSEIFIKGKEVEFKLAGNSSFIRVRGNRVKMTETWGEIQGKWNIVGVSGESALSEFEVSGFCCSQKLCTQQSRKVIWDMISTLVLDTVAVEPTFVAFL